MDLVVPCLQYAEVLLLKPLGGLAARFCEWGLGEWRFIGKESEGLGYHAEVDFEECRRNTCEGTRGDVKVT